MKLYVFPPSPRACKVLAVAHHLNLPFEQVMVNLLAGEQKKPEFLKLNPNARMPVLEDEGFVVWESNAVMQYLAEKKPGPLFPADPRTRIDVVRWQFWDAQHWDPVCATLLFENVVKGLFGGGAPDPVKVKEGQDKFAPLAKILDTHLASRQWLVGKDVTIADLGIAAPLHYAAACNMPIDQYPNVKAWYGRIAALDAWKKSAPPKN
jgi:glutathione S-transferase